MVQLSLAASSAAAAPTRNDPCCSVNVRSATFGIAVGVVRETAGGPARRVAVDHGEVLVGVVLRDLVDVRGEREPDSDDQVVARLGQVGDVLAAVGARRVRLEELRVLEADEPVSDRVLQARVRRIVERLVAEPADVERETDLDVLIALTGALAPAPRRTRAVRARRGDQDQYHDRRCQRSEHLDIHSPSVSVRSPRRRGPAAPDSRPNRRRRQSRSRGSQSRDIQTPMGDLRARGPCGCTTTSDPR